MLNDTISVLIQSHEETQTDDTGYENENKTKYIKQVKIEDTIKHRY